MKKSNITITASYDSESDAAYVYFKQNIEYGEAKETLTVDGDMSLDINLDMDASKKILGIEILDASKYLPDDLLKKIK